jgi:tripartite ATP-independent transporter DctP family solute receptor
MFRRNAVLTGLAVVIGLALPPGISEAQNVRLRYAHVGSEGDIQFWYGEQAAKRIPEVTGGRVTVTVFPNSQLGGVQEMIDGVKSGSISMGHHEFASLDRVAKDIAVFSAPFVYRDGAHALAATDPAKSELLEEFNKKLVAGGNMRIVGRLYRGARQMTAKQAVYSPADLQGKRFRGVPVQLWTTMVRGFGAIPTPVEVSELPTALMTGMVIGQENPLTMINANKLYEVQTHVMMTAHMQNVLPVFINERSWQQIGEKDRAAILQALDGLAQESLKMAEKAEQELIGELKKKGMTIITAKDGLKVDEFRQRVSAEVDKDFPSWKSYRERITALK